MSDEEKNIFDFFESEEEDQPSANGGTGQAKSGTTLQNKGDLANGQAQCGTNSLQQLSGKNNAASSLAGEDVNTAQLSKDAPSADQAALALNNATTSDERAALLDQNQGLNAPATRDKTSRVNRKLEHYSVPEIYKYDFEANPKPWNENGKQDMDKYFNYGFTEETWRYHAKEMLQRAPLNDELSKSKDLQKRATNHFFFKSQFNFVLPHQFGGFADPDAPRTYTVQVPVQKPPQPEPTELAAVDSNIASSAVAEDSTTQVQQPGSPTISQQLNMTNQEKELSTESMEQVEIEIPSLAHVNLYNDNVDLPQIKPRTVNNRNEFFVKVPYEQGFEISKEEARRAIGRTVLAEYEVKTLTPLRQQLREKQEILKKKQNQLYDLKRSMDGHGRRGYMGRGDYNNQGYNNSSYYGNNKSEGRGGRGGHRESAGKYHRESAGKYGGRDQDMSSYDSGAQYHNDRHRDDDNMSYGGSRQGRSERAVGRDYHHHDSRSSSMRGNHQRAKSRSPSSSHGGKDGRSKSGKDHHHDRRRSRSRDRSPRSRSPRDKKQQQSGKDGKSGSDRRDIDNDKRKSGTTSGHVQSSSSTRRRNDSRESDKKTDHHRSRQKSDDYKSTGDKSRHQRTNRSHSSERDKGKRGGPRDDRRGGDQATGKSGSDARQRLGNEPSSTKSGADQAQQKSKDDRRSGRQKSPLPASKSKANDNRDRSNTNNSRRRDQSPEDRSRNQSKKGTNDSKSGNQSRRRNSRSPETGASGNKSWNNSKGGQQSKVGNANKKPDNSSNNQRQQQSQQSQKKQGANSNNGNSGTKQPLQIERKGSMSGGSNQTPNKGGQAAEHRKGGANNKDDQQQQKQGNGRSNRNNRRNQNTNNEQRKGSESPRNHRGAANAKDQVKKHVVIQGKKQGSEPLYIKKRK